jgi:hypothetical protein
VSTCLGKVKNILIYTELVRIREEKPIFKNFGPLSALSVQIGQNSKFGRSLFGRCTFYSALPFLSYEAEQSVSWQQ